MGQHRAMQKDVNDKIRLKAAACTHCPDGFSETRVDGDRTLFSLNEDAVAHTYTDMQR